MARKSQRWSTRSRLLEPTDIDEPADREAVMTREIKLLIALAVATGACTPAERGGYMPTGEGGDLGNNAGGADGQSIDAGPKGGSAGHGGLGGDGGTGARGGGTGAGEDAATATADTGV